VGAGADTGAGGATATGAATAAACATGAAAGADATGLAAAGTMAEVPGGTVAPPDSALKASIRTQAIANPAYSSGAKASSARLCTAIE